MGKKDVENTTDSMKKPVKKPVFVEPKPKRVKKPEEIIKRAKDPEKMMKKVKDPEEIIKKVKDPEKMMKKVKEPEEIMKKGEEPEEIIYTHHLEPKEIDISEFIGHAEPEATHESKKQAIDDIFGFKSKESEIAEATAAKEEKKQALVDNYQMSEEELDAMAEQVANLEDALLGIAIGKKMTHDDRQAIAGAWSPVLKKYSPIMSKHMPLIAAICINSSVIAKVVLNAKTEQKLALDPAFWNMPEAQKQKLCTKYGLDYDAMQEVRGNGPDA